MFKLMDKKVITILRLNILLNWPYEKMRQHMRFEYLPQQMSSVLPSAEMFLISEADEPILCRFWGAFKPHFGGGLTSHFLEARSQVFGLLPESRLASLSRWFQSRFWELVPMTI